MAAAAAAGRLHDIYAIGGFICGDTQSDWDAEQVAVRVDSRLCGWMRTSKSGGVLFVTSAREKSVCKVRGAKKTSGTAQTAGG